MAQEVNQSETDVPARVRSKLVDKISSERCDLWISSEALWNWDGQRLTLGFPTDFACQIARKMLGREVLQAAESIVGEAAQVEFAVVSGTALEAETPISTEMAKSAVDWRDMGAQDTGAQAHGDCVTVGESASAVATLSQNGAQAATGPALPGCGPHRQKARGQATLFGMSAGGGTRQEVPSMQVASGPSLTAPNQLSAPVATTNPVSANRSESNQLASAAGDLQLARKSPRQLDQASPNHQRHAVPLLQHFVAGSCNQLALSTAKLVLETPGSLTPVLLHGPCGSGKSMLAAAIAQMLRTEKRLRRVVSMTSEQFTNDFTEGLRAGGLPLFRRKYRDVDALIVEDIQFFKGKKSTLAELRHTIDNLLRQHKQVVLTADRSANELQPLGPEMLGRLRSGMMAPMFALDETVRRQILKRKLTAANVQLDAGCIAQLADRISGDGRVLSGVVNRLVAAQAMGREGHGDAPLTMDQCWNAVFDLVQAMRPVVRLNDIERVVCSVFGLDANCLQSASKTRSVSQPRMIAMFLARKHTPAAYKEIGQYFGRRRHSTVISAEKTVESWLAGGSEVQVSRGLNVKDALRYVESQLQVG